MSSTPTLDARLRSAALRLRLARALDASVLGASLGLALLGLGFLARAVLPPYLPLAVAALAAAIAGARAVPELAMLNRLDRSHGLHDLLSSAWSLAQLPPVGRSVMAQAMFARAERAAGALDLSRAQPVRAPRHLVWLAGALLFVALAWGGARHQPPMAASERAQPGAARPAPAGERLLSDQALAAFREQLARLDPEPSAEGGAAVLRAELDALLERLAREPMERLAALRTLRDLEARANTLAARSGKAHSDDSAERGAAPQQPSQPDRARPDDPPPSAATPEPEPEPEPEQGQQAPPPGGPGLPQQPQPGARGQPGALPAPPAGLPQPMAATPARPGSQDAPRGPELERRPVPNDPERARGLVDAIAELRELLRREPPSGNDARGAPHTPQSSEPSDERSDRPGAAAAAAQQPSSGDAAKPESPAPQLPAAATRVEAEQGGGPLRSQVIYGAAERGWGGRDYAHVHAEYEDHAEREIERDQLPPGYRGYVRRYFQAIAPRPKP